MVWYPNQVPPHSVFGSIGGSPAPSQAPFVEQGVSSAPYAGLPPMPPQNSFAVGYAAGGMVRTNTSGRADDVSIPVSDGSTAQLSGGEYVIPADVVSALGDGNSEAGASLLDRLVEHVRASRTGRKSQPSSALSALGTEGI